MPCDTRRLYPADLSVANREMVAMVVKAKGWTLKDDVIQTPKGRIFLTEPGKVACEFSLQGLVQELNTDLCRAVATKAALKAGWMKTAKNKEQTKFRMSRGM